MKNTHYSHFEEWISDWRRNNHEDEADISDHDLIGLYMAMFPGRTQRLLVELIEIARVWSREQEVVKEIGEANASSS